MKAHGPPLGLPVNQHRYSQTPSWHSAYRCAPSVTSCGSCKKKICTLLLTFDQAGSNPIASHYYFPSSFQWVLTGTGLQTTQGSHRTRGSCSTVLACSPVQGQGRCVCLCLGLCSLWGDAHPLHTLVQKAGLFWSCPACLGLTASALISSRGGRQTDLLHSTD